MKLRRILATRRSCSYEHLIGRLLEIPLIWESDLKTWLKDMRKTGEVEIPELTGRQRTPKPGHAIVWKGDEPEETRS